jgi:hypothetical protein
MSRGRGPADGATAAGGCYCCLRSSNRIAWRTESANLATLEDLMTRSPADTKYMEAIESGGTNFIPGSVNDSIWKTI